MNNNLSPTCQKKFDSCWVLWYKKSNIYSVVDANFKELLDSYFASISLHDFTSNLPSLDPEVNPSAIAENIYSYLEQCNTKEETSEEQSSLFCSSKQHLSSYYKFDDKSFQINFDSDLVKKTIHPAIAHLEVEENNHPKIVFDIYLNEDELCLFKNEALITAVPKKEYHKLQGKFIMELLSIVHDKQESDWLGTFHGSTISDGNNSILLIGLSGKGKSTLSAILVANGFELLADDVSPILSADRHIYHNPSAISIKKGAFDILRPLINNFDDIPTTFFNKTKGLLKYVPCKRPLKNNYPCRALIMVNYCKGEDTKLETLSINEILETLIPDSWLSSNPTHAKQFLDWLEDIDIYKLTYSDTTSVIEKTTTLFKEFKTN